MGTGGDNRVREGKPDLFPGKINQKGDNREGGLSFLRKRKTNAVISFLLETLPLKGRTRRLRGSACPGAPKNQKNLQHKTGLGIVGGGGGVGGGRKKGGTLIGGNPNHGRAQGRDAAFCLAEKKRGDSKNWRGRSETREASLAVFPGG